MHFDFESAYNKKLSVFSESIEESHDRKHDLQRFLKMPKVDGFGLITEIRKKQLHYVYILVQTHREDEEALVKALSLGADDF